jgi:hypothetical protein
LFLLLEDPAPVDPAVLLSALDAGPVVATPVDVSRREALTGLRTWLALHEPAAGDLLAQRENAQRPMPVLVGSGGLAALAPAGPATEVQGYGADGDAAGRPAARSRPRLGRSRPPRLQPVAHSRLPRRHRRIRPHHRPAAHPVQGGVV